MLGLISKVHLSESVLLRNLLLQSLVFITIFLCISAFKSYDMLGNATALDKLSTPLTTLDGEDIDLNGAKLHSTHINNASTVYYFFAPWCQVCHASIGNLQTLYQNNNQINIVVVALDFVDKQQVQDFAKEHQLTMPIALGNEQVKQSFRIKGYPSYYVVSEDNTIKYSSIGYSSELGLYFRTL